MGNLSNIVFPIILTLLTLAYGVSLYQVSGVSRDVTTYFSLAQHLEDSGRYAQSLDLAFDGSSPEIRSEINFAPGWPTALYFMNKVTGGNTFNSARLLVFTSLVFTIFSTYYLIIGSGVEKLYAFCASVLWLIFPFSYKVFHYLHTEPFFIASVMGVISLGYMIISRKQENNTILAIVLGLLIALAGLIKFLAVFLVAVLAYLFIKKYINTREFLLSTVIAISGPALWFARNIYISGTMSRLHFQETLRPKPVIALYEMLAGINILLPFVVFGALGLWTLLLIKKSSDEKSEESANRNALAAMFSIAGASLLIGLFILGSFLDFDMIGIRLLTPALLPMLIGSILFLYPIWERLVQKNLTKALVYSGIGLVFTCFFIIDMKIGLPSIYGEREETVAFYDELKTQDYYKDAPFLVTDFHTGAQIFSLKPLASIVGEQKETQVFESILESNPKALLILRQIDENTELIESLSDISSIELMPEINNSRKIFKYKS